ncbi:hypothetical protein BKA69DRAFT_1128840 [Paraphysoderma sedebokerense]|nr:hypothetical protein BKA69DRAFT_1128840 [Paraphysoderma sedebokerense]
MTDTKLQELSEQVASSQLRTDQLVQQIAELTQEMARQNTANQQMTQQVAELTQEMARQNTANQQMNQQVAELTQQIAERYSQLDNRISELAGRRPKRSNTAVKRVTFDEQQLVTIFFLE